jgi:Na+/H+-dicarboxylate symporter
VSSTWLILLGLVAGLGVGAAISAWDLAWLRVLVPALEPVGQVFVNAIRMVVIPLIVSKLIVGVAGAGDGRVVRALGTASVLFFVVTLFAAATVGVVVGWPLLGFLQIDPAVAASLHGTATTPGGAAAAELPSFGRWVSALVPANPFQAAADGAMLPLIVFAVAFAVSLLHVPGERRRPVVDLLQIVAEAMLTLVRWILTLAPIGVFALAVPLAARMGLAAAGALLYYVAVVAGACLAFAVLVLYPVAFVFGRVAAVRFVRAAAPAQAIAFSTRSSMASLPVMMDQGRVLGLRDDVIGFFLPLAVAMFRGGSVIGTTIGALFVARLYGVSLDAGQMATMIPVAVAATVGSPGVPSGSVLMIAPVLAAAGVPPEGFGLLLGVDTLPDMFRTTTNITANMTGAVVVDRFTGRRRSAVVSPERSSDA